MSYATNGQDGTRIYFEDDGGGGAPVLLHDGFGDSVQDLRESEIAGALPAGEFRLSTPITAVTVAATSPTTPLRTQCRCASPTR